MRLNLIICTALMLLPVGFLPEAKTKTMRLVICHNRTMTIVDGAESFSVGLCAGGEWASPLTLKHSIIGEDETSTAKSKELLSLLQSIPVKSFKPKQIDGVLTKAAKISPTKENVVISPNKLPTHVRAFFMRAESKPHSMVFVISVGARIVGEDENYVKKYEEYYYYIVRVRGNNPTIGEILEEVRELTFDEIIEHHGPDLSLMHPATQDNFDNRKSVTDYGLTNGAVLWLVSEVR
ncbi:MAG TPA: hypothetical protein VF656_03320 [Pyrinomonadaceae bacterium]|jgi:hypothetical protein